MDFDNNHVTIDLDAIAHNFDAVCHKRTAAVMAVVKADAYGHGAVPVARLLAPKCGFFGVSSLAEALELRYAGIQKPILILGRTPAGSFPIAPVYTSNTFSEISFFPADFIITFSKSSDFVSLSTMNATSFATFGNFDISLYFIPSCFISDNFSKLISNT